MKNLWGTLLGILTSSLLATPMYAQQEPNLSILQKIVPMDWGLEEVDEFLGGLQFRNDTYVVQDNELFDYAGLNATSVLIFHPELPEDFFAGCLHQECVLLRTTRKVPAFLSGFDHEYRYLWLFLNDELNTVYAHHGRWVFRK